MGNCTTPQFNQSSTLVKQWFWICGHMYSIFYQVFEFIKYYFNDHHCLMIALNSFFTKVNKEAFLHKQGAILIPKNRSMCLYDSPSLKFNPLLNVQFSSISKNQLNYSWEC